MQRHKVLINLALAVVFMFGAAFSCRPSKNIDRTPRSDRPTEEDVSQLVTRRMTATSIESVEFGSSRTADARDEDRGVPKGGTVYAVKVRYTHIERLQTIEPKVEKEYYAFDFYIDRFGQWNAILLGPVANQPA